MPLDSALEPYDHHKNLLYDAQEQQFLEDGGRSHGDGSPQWLLVLRIANSLALLMRSAN